MEDEVKTDAPRKSLKILVWRVARFPEEEKIGLAVGVLLLEQAPSPKNFSEVLP
jgi:hypothetical protein